MKLANGSLSLDSHCRKCTDNCCRWGPLLILEDEWETIRARAQTLPENARDTYQQAESLLRQDKGFLVLDKKPGEPCPFLTTDQRCGIYDIRPLDCRLWPAYHPAQRSESLLSISPRCPAVKDLQLRYLYAARRAMRQIPDRLQRTFYQTTVDQGYQLIPFESSQLAAPPQAESPRLALEAEAKVLLVGILLGFGVVEAVKSLINVAAVKSSLLPIEYAFISGLMLGYVVLNSLRYFFAHVDLAYHFPVSSDFRTGFLRWVHDFFRIAEVLVLIAMAVWVRVPSSGPTESAWPPVALDVAAFASSIDVLVYLFIRLNLILAILDVAWCLVMDNLLFLEYKGRTLGTPPGLRSWVRSGSLEVLMFSASLGLLKYTRHLAPAKYLFLLLLIVGVPFISLLWELIRPVRNAFQGFRNPIMPASLNLIRSILTARHDKSPRQQNAVETLLPATSVGVSVRDVAVVRGTKEVLSNVNLVLSPGEYISLVGKNGSGKSTLLMAIAGHVALVRGSISLDGQQIDRLPAERRPTSLVFQEYSLFPFMSNFENILFPLRVRHLLNKQTLEEARDLCKTLDLTSAVLDRNPETVSGGERQKVALARAVIWHPKVLLLDEPLAALDPIFHPYGRLILRQLHERLGCTTVHVTHSLEEAFASGSRVALISDGHILQCEKPEVLKRAPAQTHVAEFIGHIGCFPVEVGVFPDRAPRPEEATYFSVPQESIVLDQLREGVAHLPGRVLASAPEVDQRSVCTLIEVLHPAGKGRIFRLLTDREFTRNQNVDLAWNPVETVWFSKTGHRI